MKQSQEEQDYPLLTAMYGALAVILAFTTVAGEVLVLESSWAAAEFGTSSSMQTCMQE